MNFKPVLLAALVISGSSLASEELAQSSNCLACHKLDAPLLGPSYQEVAAKYKDQQGADEMLFESIKNGASGKWGAIPMPANSAVADEDIKTLTAWILAM